VVTVPDSICLILIDVKFIFVYYNNMGKEYWGSKFYGSKLNTILLLVLVTLMIFALRIMYKDKGTYFPIVSENISLLK